MDAKIVTFKGEPLYLDVDVPEHDTNLSLCLSCNFVQRIDGLGRLDDEKVKQLGDEMGDHLLTHDRGTHGRGRGTADPIRPARTARATE